MKKLLFLLTIGLTPVLSMAAEGQTAESSGSLTTFIWIAAIVFFVTGIILGCKKIIVIYNDYLDIVISTLIFLFPIIMGFIIDKEDTGLYIFFVLVEVGLCSTCRLHRVSGYDISADNNSACYLHSVILRYEAQWQTVGRTH